MGRLHFTQEQQDSEIWADFMSALQTGPLAANGADSVFDKAAQVATKWRAGQYQRLSGYDQSFPPYLAYLVFSILPLIEVQGSYNTNNYHGRMEDFIKENGPYEIGSKPRRPQNLRNKLQDIDHLWDELADWANVRMDSQWGSFQAGYTGNKSWKYVAKPLSQCVFPPIAIRRLPEFFSKASLIPGDFYTQRSFRDLLIDKGVQWLGLRADAISLIQGESGLGKSLTELVQTEFSRWTGEQFQLTGEEKERAYRIGTIVPLLVQLKPGTAGQVSFSYRAAFNTEPPADLCLGGMDDLYQGENWSRTLDIEFQDTLVLQDKVHKWKAQSPNREIRLFINAAHFNLNSRFWLETLRLSRIDDMYLLCKESLTEKIKNWGRENCATFSDQSELQGLPVGYALFRFSKPRASHPEFEMLKVQGEKSVSVRESTGLKVSYNRYLNHYMPEFTVSNAEGNEKPFLRYRDDDTQQNLLAHPSLGGVWLLPKEVRVGSPFTICLKDVAAEGAKFYEIIRPFLNDLKNENVPLRDAFGNPVENPAESYQGNLIKVSTKLESLADRNPFTPNLKWIPCQNDASPTSDNILMNWLIATVNTNTAGFNCAFEYICRQLFPGEPTRLLQKRKSAVNLLDYLGYIDYDYNKDKITALPPKLISLPTSSGRKALLIGCASAGLLEDLAAYCRAHQEDISISVNPRSLQHQEMLIPPVITFECAQVGTLERLAEKASIEFDEWYLLKLKALLPSLSDYKAMLLGGESAQSWDGVDIEQKSFSLQTLAFMPGQDYDRNYALIECRPKYLPEYGIWIKGSYYVVDKNWGKYLLFHHYSPKVYSYDRDIDLAGTKRLLRNGTKLALPAQLPLPRLFSRLIIQLGGIAPEFKQLNIQGVRGSYNIYGNTGTPFIDNLFKFKLNIEIHKTDEPL